MDGAALKLARKEAGFTQASLGEALGVSRELIRDIELGVVSGSNLIEQIAELLGVDPTELDPEFIAGGAQPFNLDPRLPERSMPDGFQG